MNQMYDKDYFQTLYRNDRDPWKFATSAYEMNKYQHTLNAIPQLGYERMLELGCSIGVFTSMLFPRGKNLLAIDCAQEALDIAKRNVGADAGVLYECLSIPDAFPKGTFDLIVFSEMGYYLSKAALHRAQELVINAMEEKAYLCLVHWRHPIAGCEWTGDEVHELFYRSSLNIMYSDIQKDYRIDVFQK